MQSFMKPTLHVMIFIYDDKVVFSKDSNDNIRKQAHHYEEERVEPIRIGSQDMGVDLKNVWVQREDRDNVSVKWGITAKHVTEEIEQASIDSEVGEANVESNVDSDGEDDGGHHGYTPGSGLEHQLEIDHSHHS